MSLIPEVLATRIITAAKNEVNRCGGVDNFDPSMFNSKFYLDEVYDYIKNEAQINAIYSGLLPNGSPDPLNGLKSFKLFSVGNYNVTQEGNEFPTAANTWWDTFIPSITITSEITEVTGITLESAFVGSPIPESRPDVSDFNIYGSMESVWSKFSEEIIDRIKRMNLLPISATSTAGGKGTCTVESIL